MKWALLGQGYSRTAVEKAVELANRQLAAEAPKIEPPKEVKTEIIEPEEKKQGFFSRLLNFFKK